MTVLAKSKSGVSRIRRHRNGRPEHVTGRGDSPATAADVTDSDQGTASARRRRDAGVTQDLAVYTCQCGFVFEALVSTSVGCPHCGDSQAW